MPRSAALVFAVASLVAAAAFAYHVLDGGGSESTAEVEGTDAATLAALRDLRQRLDRVEHEVFQPRLAPTDPAAHAESLASLVKLWEKLRKTERAAKARNTLNTQYGNSPWAKQGG